MGLIRRKTLFVQEGYAISAKAKSGLDHQIQDFLSVKEVVDVILPQRAVIISII